MPSSKVAKPAKEKAVKKTVKTKKVAKPKVAKAPKAPKAPKEAKPKKKVKFPYSPKLQSVFLPRPSRPDLKPHLVFAVSLSSLFRPFLN